MGRAIQVALAFLLALTGPALRAGDVIDRIVATVNGVPILQSDLEEAVRYEVMLDNRPLESITGAEQRAALDRLIDQELLRQQMGAVFPKATAAELAERIRQVKTPLAQSEEKWRELLARYGLTESELNERLATQLQILAFTESHLQPDVHVDAASVQAYYRENLLPELRKRGVKTEPSLAEVSGQIEHILWQQRINEMLGSWLQTLRQQSQIRIEAGPSPAMEPGARSVAGAKSK